MKHENKVDVEQTQPAPRDHTSAHPDGDCSSTLCADGGVPGEEAKTGEVHNATAEPLTPEQQLREQVQQMEDKLLRARADYQNLQRRVTVQIADTVRYATADLIKSLLGVLDDLERSLEAAKSSDDAAVLVDGVQLVYNNLLKTLRDQGLEPIGALHETFDPNLHEALMQQPTEEYPPGTVMAEVARGYRFHNRVLRPSKVVVSSATPPAAGAPPPVPSTGISKE